MPNDPYKIIPGVGLNSPEFKKSQEIIDAADAGLRATNYINAIDQVKKFEADKIKLDQSVGSSITDILATKAALDASSGPTLGESVLAGLQLSASQGQMYGTPESFLKSKKELANYTKDPDITRAAAIYKDRIKNGSPSEIYKAIADLRKSYDYSNESIKEEDRALFTKSYQNLADYGKSVAIYKYAQDNVNQWLNEGGQVGKNFAPKGLKGQKTTDRDILNTLSNFDSLRKGSKIYNNKHLAAFQSLSDEELRTNPGTRSLVAGLDTEYNRTVLNVLNDKSSELSEQVNQLNSRIDKSVNDQERQTLTQQKLQLEQSNKKLDGLAKQLKPFANEDLYLKTFFKDLYEEKQAFKRREYYKNEVDPKDGFIDDATEFAQRTLSTTGANLVRTWSGVQELTGFNKSAFFSGLNADRLSPLSYRMGKDLNKNYQIDESELVRDVNGNVVTHDAPVYTDAKGERHWNGEAIFEQVLPIATDILITTMLSKGAGGLARMVPGGALRWSSIGKTFGLTAEGMNSVRPYVSTFGTVTASTFPRFYAEELRNFKEGGAASTAFLRAAAEGLTESILPDTDLFFGTKGGVGLLDTVFKKGADYVGGKVDNLTGGALGKMNTRLTAQTDLMLSMLPKGMVTRQTMAALLAPGLRKTLSAGAQESLEEIGSLVANHFVDKYAATQNFEYEQNNELTWGTVWETFVTSLGPSAVIGGASAFGRRALKEEKDSEGNTMRNADGSVKYVTDWKTSALAYERANTARWNVANNPEIYKKLISQKKESGEYTAERAIKETAIVERMSQKLATMLPSMQSIKNLNTLLDDPNARLEYFNNKLFAEELLNVDIANLSAEDRKSYEDSVNSTANKLAKTERIIDQYESMSETDKRAVIKKLYDDKVAAAQSDDSTIPELISAGFALDPTDLDAKKKDDRFRFIADLNEEYQKAVTNTLAKRVSEFRNTLANSPENLTVRELLAMAEVFGPALQQLEERNQEVPFSPLMETQQARTSEGIQGPQPLYAAPDLMQLIKQELGNRTVLTEAQAIEQGAMSLTIADVKRDQELDMALAELTDEEMSKGFVEETAHPEWSPMVRAVIAGMLESHSAEKLETGKQTNVEKRKERILNDFYGFVEKNAEASKRIAQVNKAIREEAAKGQVRKNFGGRVQRAQPIDPTQPFIGLSAINQEVFDEFDSYVKELSSIVYNSDLDDSEIKEAKGSFSVQILAALEKLETFQDLYSALSALYPSSKLAFSKFFQEAAEGNYDISTIDKLDLSPTMVSKIFILAKLAVPAMTPYQKMEQYIRRFYEIETIEELNAFDAAEHKEDPDRRFVSAKMVAVKRKEINKRLAYAQEKKENYTPIKVGNKTFLFKIEQLPNNKKALRIVNPETQKPITKGKVVDAIISQLIATGQLFELHNFEYAVSESETARYSPAENEIDFIVEELLGSIGGVYLNKVSLDLLASADRPTAFNFSPYVSTKRKGSGDASVQTLEDLFGNEELLAQFGVTPDDIVSFLKRHKTQKYVPKVGKEFADNIIRREILDAFNVTISQDMVPKIVSAYTSRFVVNPVTNDIVDLNNLPFELRDDLVTAIRERNADSIFLDSIPTRDEDLNFYDPYILGMIGDVLAQPEFRSTIDPTYLNYLDEFYEDATNVIYSLSSYEDVSGLFAEETTQAEDETDDLDLFGEDLSDTQNKLSIVVSSPFDIGLAMINTNRFNESQLSDPNVSFVYNILHQFRENGGQGQDLKVYLSSMLNVYKKLLSSEDFESLNQLRQDGLLTPGPLSADKQKELLRILTQENIPLHNKEFLAEIIANPSQIGSGLGALFIDSSKNVHYFNASGQKSTTGTAAIFTLKDTTSLKITESELALRETLASNPNQVLISSVSGIISGKTIPLNLTTTPGEIILNTEEANRTVVSAFGEYTLFKGAAYLYNKDAVYPYQAILLPAAQDGFVEALVDAFNAGKLPAGLPTELKENPKEFVNYIQALVYVGSKKNKGLAIGVNKQGKVVYRAKNVTGKYQQITGKPETIKNRVAEAFANTRYNINKDYLDSNAGFPFMTMIDGNLAVIPFDTYQDMLKSTTFGAEVVSDVNARFALDNEFTIETQDTLNIPDNVDVVLPAIADLTIADTVIDEDNDIDYSSLFGDDIDDNEPLFRSIELENKISEQENARAKDWVESNPIFKNTKFIFDETTTHPEAYAVWSKAGIFLYKGANYAEGYHEAWHEFSQFYLTKEQKDALYAQAKKLYGNLSQVQLEEKLAEDFRQFALSNGTVFPEAIKKNKEAKGLFQQMWDFLTNFFSNKKTVDYYFTQLYNGQITGYTRDNTQAYFKQLFSSKFAPILPDGTQKVFSFKEGDQILTQLDSLFVNFANQLVADVKGSLVNVLDNKSHIIRTYKSLNAGLLLAQSKYKQLVEENPTAMRVARLEYLDMLVANRQSLFLFHKTASTLFNDKVKKALNDELVDDVLKNESPAFAQFESAVNDQSQKLKASPLIITAIKSLPQYKNNRPVKDKIFGVNVIGDFDTNWNILQRTLTGSNSYADTYKRIQELSKRYGQFRQLLTYLPNPSETNIRQSTLNFKNEFFNTFSMPYLDGYTGEITKKESEDNETTVEFELYKAQSLDSKNLRKAWDVTFFTTSGPYKSINSETFSYYLNADKYFEDFPSVPDEPSSPTAEQKLAYQNTLYAILAPLGFNFSEVGKEALFTMPLKDFQREVRRIHDKIMSLAEVEKNIFAPLGRISSKHINDEGEEVFSEQSALLKLIQYEVQSNVEYVNDMQFNALGKKVWSVNPHTYMTKVLSVLNDGVLYPTLMDVYKELPQLDPFKNPNATYSAVIKYLFNAAGNRRQNPDMSTRTFDIANLLGIKEGFEGEKTIDVVTPVKHYADVMGLVKSGVEEVNRFSGKSTTRGLVFDERFRYELGMKQSFSYGERIIIPDAVINNHILPILFGEILVTLNPSSRFRGPVFDENGIPTLSYFVGILSADTRKTLYDGLKDATLQNIVSFYEKLPQELRNSILQQFNEYIADNIKQSQKIFQGVYNVSFDDLVKYHVISFISRVEQFKLFYGHPYFYKNDKEIEKRISSWNAYGSYPLVDKQNLDSIHDGYAQRDIFLASNNTSQEPVDVSQNLNRDMSKISYIVLNDTPVNSATALRSDSYNRVAGKKKGKEVTLKEYYTDKESKRQDAACFATMDFYKRFYKLSTGVTEAMRKEFDRQDRIYSLYLATQKNVSGAQEELNKVLNEGPYYSFTIKKLQYAGHSEVDSSESVPVFHKYSVKPILPSELIGNPELAKILEKLHVSGADYAVFDSGTKIGETVAPVDLFAADGSINAEAVPTGLVDIKYLKEQVLVENKETFMSIFSTQFRKLAYKDSGNTELYQAYKKYIDELVSLDKISFITKLEDQEKLVEYLLDELSKKNVGEATKDLIRLKQNGELQHTLDAMIDRTIMESAIVSSVTNEILKQKVPGAQRVQFPVSLIRPGRTLGYYELVTDENGNTRIKQAEAIVSFSSGYYPLLNLEYNGATIGEFGSNGKPTNLTTAIFKLNEALQNPVFLRKNKAVLDKALTMVAIRVPGQDYNSMENLRIVEFLPQESGEIILLPDEMVIKSGSDYDIDKLFCYDPFIELDGSVLTSDLTPQQAYEAREDVKEELRAIREAKKDVSKNINALRKRVEDIINTAGFDGSTKRLKDLYKTYQSFTAPVVDEVPFEQQLLNLQNKFKGTYEPVKQKINEESKRIQTALRTAKREGLSDSLFSLNETLVGLLNREAELTHEVKAIRGRMTNNLLFNLSERLSQEEIFTLLLRPNSSDIVTEMADKFGQANTYTTASYTNIVNSIYQLYVHQLNAFKKSLGVDAKSNVLHALLQKAGLKVIDKQAVSHYPLDANGKKDGVLDFTQVFDVEHIASGGKKGQRIGDISGQLITAHVDIERDDNVAKIFLNNRLTPTANYMNMLGSSFRDIVKLINLPYTNNEGVLTQSSVIKYAKGSAKFSRKNDFIQSILMDKLDKALVKAQKTGLPIPEYAEILNGSLNAFGTEIMLNALQNKLAVFRTKNPDALLNDDTEMGDLLRFVGWLAAEAQQDKLFVLSANTDYDTFTPQNFESFRKGAQELKDLINSRFFNEDAIRNMIFETVVSPFQLQQDIFDKLESIFPISANKNLTTLIIKLHRSIKEINFRLDYDKFSRIFKNDLLYALFRNNIPEVAAYEKVLTKSNPGHLGVLHADLRGRLATRGIEADNLIFEGATFSTNEDTEYIRTGFVQTDIDYTVNILREDFANGFNWSHPALDPTNEEDVRLQQDMQSFFEAFAYAGIIGTQLNKRYDSYLPLIPEQIYTLPMSSIIADFTKSLGDSVANITQALNKDFEKSENEQLKDTLEEAMNYSAEDRAEKVNNVLSEQLDTLLSTVGDSFMADFVRRFKELHPEFIYLKDKNIDLTYFKDYDLSRENTTPSSKVTQSSLTTRTDNPNRKYTPKEVLTLEPNQVFVFGANTAGHHGSGGAGYAQYKNARANYDVLEVGTKGYWSEYGIVNKLMQGTNGKSFGIITKYASVASGRVKIGSKNSVSLSTIEESVLEMLNAANQNPQLEFLVSEFGSQQAGWTKRQMRAILAKHIAIIPDNVILPKAYEVRDTVKELPKTTIVNNREVLLVPENFAEIRRVAIEETFSELSSINRNNENLCAGS
jgi:hypothetical protein